MHASKLLELNAALLVVMLTCFFVIDRYAKRHPYGTGHFGKMERRRRAREAHHQRKQQPDGQVKARNEAAMAALLAPMRPANGATTSSGSEAEQPQHESRP